MFHRLDSIGGPPKPCHVLSENSAFSNCFQIWDGSPTVFNGHKYGTGRQKRHQAFPKSLSAAQ